jgi:hypothetical protein
MHEQSAGAGEFHVNPQEAGSSDVEDNSHPVAEVCETPRMATRPRNPIDLVDKALDLCRLLETKRKSRIVRALARTLVTELQRNEKKARARARKAASRSR